jgi:predicted pyridoxine 5'-phosphate oxidase superfamily flavin-nucleotide-binding protein
MIHRFGELMFTPHVQAVQQEMGSRRAYASLAQLDGSGHDRLGEQEAAFIAARDSFYLATISETGWPYVQHRGGPEGFLKMLDPGTVGFADYRGNRQYVSVGNLATDNRISLILVDYPHRQRLKLLGHARVVHRDDEPELLNRLEDAYAVTIERGIVVTLEAFDWNCPQHIMPRFSAREVADITTPLRDRIRVLEAEVEALRAAPSKPDSGSPR